jgi:hypothetical protein
MKKGKKIENLKIGVLEGTAEKVELPHIMDLKDEVYDSEEVMKKEEKNRRVSTS